MIPTDIAASITLASVMLKETNNVKHFAIMMTNVWVIHLPNRTTVRVSIAASIQIQTARRNLYPETGVMYNNPINCFSATTPGRAKQDATLKTEVSYEM